MSRDITEAQADAAYTILVKYAGARDDEYARHNFVFNVSGTRDTGEYRFMGELGFGGKFRNNGNRDNVPHVDCYREHETPERLKIIQDTNAALLELFGADLS